MWFLVVWSRFVPPVLCFFFFFNDTATTEIYTLSLHDALPISGTWNFGAAVTQPVFTAGKIRSKDRKSTRLNSSHSQISYAVFCLKKKNSRHTADRRSPTCNAVPADIFVNFRPVATCPPSRTPT